MRTPIIVVFFLIALIAGTFATFRHVDRTTAQPARDLSKMMSVRLIVSEALSAHYQQYGTYPRSLSELPLQILPWGHEGSTAEDVEAWFYVSDGTTFSLTWTNTDGVELYVGGTAGTLYYSRDERRLLTTNSPSNL